MIGFRNSIPRNTRKWHYDDSEEEAEEEAAAEALAEAKAEHAEMVLAKRKEVTNSVTVTCRFCLPIESRLDRSSLTPSPPPFLFLGGGEEAKGAHEAGSVWWRCWRV